MEPTSESSHSVWHITTKNYPKLCGSKRNCPADKVSIPGTDVMSCLISLFKRLPGRSLESLVTITGLHKVGLVKRMTETEKKKSRC